METNVEENKLSCKIFLRIKKIWLFFNNPVAALTPYSLIKNIAMTMKFIENAWQIIYEPDISHISKPRMTQSDFNSLPIDELNNHIVLFNICSFAITT
jgi:hypothetical protein